MESARIMLLALGLMACGKKQNSVVIETEDSAAEVEEYYSEYRNKYLVQNLIEEDQDCSGLLTENGCDDTKDYDEYYIYQTLIGCL